MKRTSEKEISAVLQLDGAGRFEHFVKRVADSELAWGLWKDGWALMENDEGTQVFPLWPAREYAELHCNNDWAEYEPRQIPIADLIEELCPKLEQQGVLPGIFPTPTGRGVTPTPTELAHALQRELENYA